MFAAGVPRRCPAPARRARARESAQRRAAPARKRTQKNSGTTQL
jgi:hypothetical protein